MISTEQTFEPVTPETLVQRVAALRKEGWRMAAISASRKAEVLELLYSFDREYQLLSLRMELPMPARVPSVSSEYFCAVLYENELHDLFGLEVTGMAVDFKGNFYKTAVKFPFGSTKVPSAKPTTTATAPSPGAAAPSATATGTSTK